jgi:ectoine hydroxylase-related dioxygenase (phytanoyl-CoA dioxygenase family)|tara:strand:+ start:146 stop:862 length:717 start_codon:yes stop_codon:yes gene_type:complete
MEFVRAKKFKKASEMKSFYDDFGWIVLKNYIKKPEIKDVQKSLNNFFYKKLKKNCLDALAYLNKKNKQKLHELHIQSSNLTSLKRVCTRLSEIQKVLLGKKNILMHEISVAYMLSLPKDQRLVYKYHQESNYMKNYGNILNIHFPIFHQSNFENGSMSALSGSHKLGNIKYQNKKKSKDSYTDKIPQNINMISRKYKEVLFELDVGDVVFFHKDLIHKSNFNHTKTSRPVGVGRYTST